MATQQQMQSLEQMEQAEPKRRLFTVAEYERMIETGLLKDDERVELIRGEIIEMPPMGFDHGMEVARLNRILVTLLGTRALVWPQCAIRLPGKSRPQPDLALLKEQEYSANEPVTATDVLLVIEVSDTTLKSDRAVKGPLYAEAGIPEYWIINLQANVVEVYMNPVEGAYTSVREASSGDALTLPSQLGVIEVGDILGGQT